MNPFVLETSFGSAPVPAPAPQHCLRLNVQISGGVGAGPGGGGPDIVKFVYTIERVDR